MSTKPKAAQVIATSATRRNAAIFTDTVLRQGGAGESTGFCVGGGLVLTTEGALRGKTTAHFSTACLPFNGSMVGAAFSHSRNGFVISNQPRSPADQPSEEFAAGPAKWSCCSVRIACSFLLGESAPCHV